MIESCAICGEAFRNQPMCMITTQRESNWCPEESEWICFQCWSREQDKRAQELFENRKWDNEVL